MAAGVSIASEYGKLQDLWRNIERDEEWRLVIWNAQVEDMDIIDKFMEIERSPAGEFTDIFFRFDTSYQGDVKVFSESLWEEYISWFEEKVPEEYDIMAALKKDGRLYQDYHPDGSLERTAENLWSELLRFKSCIKGLEKRHFCIYIPPISYEGMDLTSWFTNVLDGIPLGIRLITIDYANQRKIKLAETKKVKFLEPRLNMPDALRNAMDKECGSYDPTNLNSLYTRQIRTVLDCTSKKSESVLDKEVSKLIDLSHQLDREDVILTTPIIAAQAYYIIQNNDKSLLYCDRTINESERMMRADDLTAYSVWKVALFLKAAIFVGTKKPDAAIHLYEQVAAAAAKRGDILYVLEGYRMSAYLNYEQGNVEEAFIRSLLALEAGSHLDIKQRRASTFAYAASMALRFCKKVRDKQDMIVLEKQLELWLGSDWRELVSAFDQQPNNKSQILSSLTKKKQK